MTKLGDPYEQLVGEVQKALHPGAEVETGEWIEGPDGERNVDVSVRGNADSGYAFVIIECKDWKRPVGIDVVDKLESTRRDLGATAAIICSNSGFARPALSKARRVGIAAISALASNDVRARLKLSQFVVAEFRQLQNYSLELFPADPATTDIPAAFELAQVLLAGDPIANWISCETDSIIRQLDSSCEFRAVYEFHAPVTFDVHGRKVPLAGIGIHGTFLLEWFGQTVDVSVSKGTFDHLSKRFTVPHDQGVAFGDFDRDAWTPTERPMRDPDLQDGEFYFDLTFFRPALPIEGKGMPVLEPFIRAQQISTEALYGDTGVAVNARVEAF